MSTHASIRDGPGGGLPVRDVHYYYVEAPEVCPGPQPEGLVERIVQFTFQRESLEQLLTLIESQELARLRMHPGTIPGVSAVGYENWGSEPIECNDDWTATLDLRKAEPPGIKRAKGIRPALEFHRTSVFLGRDPIAEEQAAGHMVPPMGILMYPSLLRVGQLYVCTDAEVADIMERLLAKAVLLNWAAFEGHPALLKRIPREVLKRMLSRPEAAIRRVALMGLEGIPNPEKGQAAWVPGPRGPGPGHRGGTHG